MIKPRVDILYLYNGQAIDGPEDPINTFNFQNIIDPVLTAERMETAALIAGSPQFEEKMRQTNLLEKPSIDFRDAQAVVHDANPIGVMLAQQRIEAAKLDRLAHVESLVDEMTVIAANLQTSGAIRRQSLLFAGSIINDQSANPSQALFGQVSYAIRYSDIDKKV